MAANSAGTPETDDFSTQRGKPKRIAEQASVAFLPKRLLSHPNGGAAAVIGHIDRSWLFTLFAPDQQKSSGIFENLCIKLMSGHTVGSAMSAMSQRVSMLSSMLVGKLLATDEPGQPLADSLTQQAIFALRDARNYVILGDPAARLAVHADRVASGRLMLPAWSQEKAPETVVPAPQAVVREVFFNGYSVLAGTYLRPPLTASEMAGILRGISLEGSRSPFIRQWYARSEAL
jgi:hypothetical protein